MIQDEIIEQFIRYIYEKETKKKAPILFPFRGSIADDDAIDSIEEFIEWLEKDDNLPEKIRGKIFDYFFPKNTNN